MILVPIQSIRIKGQQGALSMSVQFAAGEGISHATGINKVEISW